MLIGNSLPKLIFIRLAILNLRLITPASFLYCLYLLLGPSKQSLPLPLSIWAIVESCFFILVYLPLKSVLQRGTTHPVPPPKSERQLLFQRCLNSITDWSSYISGWFQGSPLSEIKRENVKAFYAWSLMNKQYVDVNKDEDAELDEYADRLDALYDHDIQPGWGKASSLRGTLEKVYIQHRPLICYVTVGIVDFLTSIRLFWNGFSYLRGSPFTSILNFPFRPYALFSAPSASPELAYWYREHTSKTKLPILFVHGIGVGLFTYVHFLSKLYHTNRDYGDGNIGIIAVSILAISSRISSPALAGEGMKGEIRKILDAHGWNEVVLVGHSYGTGIAAAIIRDKDLAKRVKAAVLLDPICFLLHFPDVAYNFTRRPPSSASERMLYYFSSRDMMISHTLARRFFWSQYVLWKEDIVGLPLTVILSGSDIIVPIKAVWEYLKQTSSRSSGPPSRKDAAVDVGGKDAIKWENGLLQLLWFQDFNHSDMFIYKPVARAVAGTVQEYCSQYGKRTRRSKR